MRLKNLTLTAALAGAFLSAPAEMYTLWSGTWAAPANELSISDPSLPAGLANLTLRQRIRTSIGGSSARIRLSNVHGKSPVTLASLHIAEAASDCDTVPNTDHAITFGHSSTVTIAAGESVLSDPITILLKPDTDLIVSLYIPAAIDAENMSGHTQAWENVYLAKGDVTADTHVTPISLTHPLTSIFYLTSLDVQNEKSIGAVAVFGASITDSSNTMFGGNNAWRILLSERLHRAGIEASVINAALSGNSLLRSNRFSGATGVSRFRHDVLEQANVKWVIFSDDPINDLSGLHPPSFEALVDAITVLQKEAHAAGVRFYCSTLTPNVGRAAEAWTPEAEQTLEKINAWYRSSNVSGSNGCDGIVDQDGAVHDPAQPHRFLPAYDAGDHLHPNDSGHRRIAESVDLSLFRH